MHVGNMNNQSSLEKKLFRNHRHIFFYNHFHCSLFSSMSYLSNLTKMVYCLGEMIEIILMYAENQCARRTAELSKI